MMNRVTGLVPIIAVTSALLIIAGIYVHINGTYTKGLDSVLSIVGGILSMFGGLIGFATSIDDTSIAKKD